MRTTIDIPDALYRRMKARAATEGRPAKTLILQAVEQALTPNAVRNGRPWLRRSPSEAARHPAVGQCPDLRNHIFSLTSTSGWR